MRCFPWGGGPCEVRQAAEPGPGASLQDAAGPAASEGLVAALSPGNVEDLYELLEELGR